MRALGLLTPSSVLTLDEWEIPRDRVVINRKLGEGAFGTVHGGESFFDEKGWVSCVSIVHYWVINSCHGACYNTVFVYCPALLYSSARCFSFSQATWGLVTTFSYPNHEP